MPFMPDPSNSRCQLYTTRTGDTLSRLAALGRLNVTDIIKDNWDVDDQQLPTFEPGLKIRLCNMPHIPEGEALKHATHCVCWFYD